MTVVADHGEELLERGKLEHGLYESLFRVPWVPCVLGEDARRFSEHVS